jgi:hypothetical protein
VRNYWYWAPPVVSVRVGLPLLDVGFYWYPGRVSWIHTETYVGWVPLAPRETYYSYRNWGGPHAVVVNNVNLTQININVRNYAYINRAVVVNQNNFYGVNNYTNVRVTNINRTTIINNYRAAPVVNNTVINNYTTNKQRYNYTNVTVKEKPHNTVVNRIQQNETIIQKGRKENAAVLQQQVKSIKEGRVNREVRIEQPKTTNYIVPASEVNRPKSEIKLQQREIKTSGKPGEQEKPVARPERVAPAKPIEKGVDKSKKVEKPKEVKPPERAIEKPKEVKPTERTIEKPKEVKPPERTIEKPKEVKPLERAIEKPKVKPPERDLEKPKDQRTLEKQIEKPREQRPVEKQIEKPKEPRISEKDLEKRKERKPPEKEEEKPRQ